MKILLSGPGQLPGSCWTRTQEGGETQPELHDDICSAAAAAPTCTGHTGRSHEPKPCLNLWSCYSCPNKQGVCRAPQTQSSALGFDFVGVVVLLSYHLLGQFLHLIQTVQLSLQVFLKLSLFPPQSLHLGHRVLFGHHRGLCQSSPTSVALLGPTYPQDLGVRLTPRL